MLIQLNLLHKHAIKNLTFNMKGITMIGYTTIGSKNLENAVSFYDSLLELVGGKRVMGMDRIKFYGTEAGGAMLAVCTPPGITTNRL